jgi:hypothetical protein
LAVGLLFGVMARAYAGVFDWRQWISDRKSASDEVEQSGVVTQ